MKAKAIGSGVYKGEKGAFWIRPTIDGGKTWRKLVSITHKAAMEEGVEILRAQRLSKIGSAKDPFQKVITVGQALQEYLETRDGKRLSAGRWSQLEAAFVHVKAWFGNMPLENIRRHHLDGYHAHRIQSTGPSLVDFEVSALSSVISWCVDRGYCEQNLLLGRQRFASSEDVTHCRDCMPKSGDELHAVAELFFSSPATEVYGWQMLFEALTGCRTSEALMMRTDAERGQPGFAEGERLDIHRSKGGTRPWVMVHADLREFMAAHKAWLAGRSVWWFPQSGEERPVNRTNMSTLLLRLHKAGKAPKLTSHGMRAYFVSKMRRDGLSDSDVATLIGDKTVSLIHAVYGAPRPGEPLLSFRRADGTASWDRWLPKAEVIQFPQATSQEPSAEHLPAQLEPMRLRVADKPQQQPLGSGFGCLEGLVVGAS